MKKLLLALLFLSFTINLQAQHNYGPNIFMGMGKFIEVESIIATNDLYQPLFVAGLGLNYEYSLSKSSRIISGLNFQSKGEKLSVDWNSLTFPDMVDNLFGFVKPMEEDPKNGKLITRYHYLIIQVPIMYQYRFNSLNYNTWLVAIGASANIATSRYVSGNAIEGFKNTTASLREHGNTFIPGALISVGYSQRLKNNKAMVYSLIYDQHLDTFYPNNDHYTDWNFNLGFSVSYLFSNNKI